MATDNKTPKLVEASSDISIKLDLEQWNIVLQCLDLTVKAGGVVNARAIIPIYDVIEQQLPAKKV